MRGRAIALVLALAAHTSQAFSAAGEGHEVLAPAALPGRGGDAPAPPAVRRSAEARGSSFALGSVGMLVHKLRSVARAHEPGGANETLIDSILEEGETFVDDELDEEETFMDIVFCGCFYVASAAIVAAVYRFLIYEEVSPLQRQIDQQQQTESFEYGLFSTEKCNMELLLCSFCCICIRWPLTLSMDGVGGPLLNFWAGFFIFVVLEGFLGALFGLLGIVHLALVVYFRQQIRKRYNLPNGSGMTIIEDLLSWACCCCCAAAQEAKQVESVKAAEKGEKQLEAEP